MTEPKPKEKCMDCEKDAKFIRHTQFAGSHPFCEEHAKKEKDFGEEDSSSFFWEEVFWEEV